MEASNLEKGLGIYLDDQHKESQISLPLSQSEKTREMKTVPNLEILLVPMMFSILQKAIR